MTKLFCIAGRFFIQDFFQKIFSEWKPYMANFVCKTCFCFIFKKEEKLLLKMLLVLEPQIAPHPTSWQYPKINYLVLITTFYSSFCSPPSSVVFWLRELCLVHEAECTIMLQSKPVGGSTSVGPAINGTGGPCAGADGAGLGSTYNQTHLGNFWAGNSKDTIRAIQSRAHAISAVFAKLCK